MKKIIAAAVTVTTVLSLAACGGNTAVDKSDCLDVPQDVLNGVASGSDSSGLKPETGKAVKGDTEGTYWLAMKFTADGFNGDTETGIWLVSGLICNSPPTLCGGCCIIARAWRVISG